METYKVLMLIECIIEYELKQLQSAVKAKPNDASIKEDLEELLRLKQVIATNKAIYLNRVLPY